MKTLCLMFSESTMPTVFTRKNNGFSRLYDRKLTQIYTTWQDGFLVPTNTAANRIACSDRCLPNNQAKLFSRRSPRSYFETKPCISMLVNTADEFAKQLIFSPDPLDAQIPRPWSYLFHNLGMQNQFPHYGQPAETLIAPSERNPFSFAKI